MRLTGLHLLLTYKCTFECDHCFVWGSPWQSGVMTQADIRAILWQARELGTVKTIYFEGGEPFLYYATLLRGVQEAAGMGFSVGIVTNAYWATSPADALEALLPMAGLLHQLTVSSDLFHASQPLSLTAQAAAGAAQALGIQTGMISIDRPDAPVDELPAGAGQVMYRGRAAVKLVQHAQTAPWNSYTTCPYENLREPGRVHVDPSGNLHICQGISLGNLSQTPLVEICAGYDPERHPITGPLLRGGPAGLAREYGLADETQMAAEGSFTAGSSSAAGSSFADACHLCYTIRGMLRERFPDELGPDQMYGV